MAVEYKGNPVNESIPAQINPHAKRPDSDLDISTLARRKLYFIMANGQGFVNLKDFNEEPYVLTSKVGAYEIWELINISPMDHPIHQHTNPAQILSITGGDQGYTSLYTSTPAWKDTINIPFQGKLTMVVPVMDFTGKALFHCHIVEHEDIGMMGICEMV